MIPIRHPSLAKALAALMAGALMAGCAGRLSAQDAAPVTPTQNTAQVILYKKMNNGEHVIDCTIPFKQATIVLNDNDSDTYGCTNDDDYYFKLENIPSASLISFHDDDDSCEKDGNFYFQIQTIQHPTTMVAPMELKVAHSGKPGSILAPGVRLKEKQGNEQVEGKLSCVKMQPSPAP